MSVLKVTGAALAAAVLLSTGAQALTITNRDTNAYTVMIQRGEQQSELPLPAGEMLEQACEEECILRLAGIEGEYIAKDTDRFVVQGGALQRDQE